MKKSVLLMGCLVVVMSQLCAVADDQTSGRVRLAPSVPPKISDQILLDQFDKCRSEDSKHPTSGCTVFLKETCKTPQRADDPTPLVIRTWCTDHIIPESAMTNRRTAKSVQDETSKSDDGKESPSAGSASSGK